MFKKTIIFTLALLLTVGSFNSAALAAAHTDREKQGSGRPVAEGESKFTREKLEGLFPRSEAQLSEKSTMAEYQQAQAKGRGFSKGKKIALGVGIAIGVVAIAVFAASRDEIRTF